MYGIDEIRSLPRPLHAGARASSEDGAERTALHPKAPHMVNRSRIVALASEVVFLQTPQHCDLALGRTSPGRWRYRVSFSPQHPPAKIGGHQLPGAGVARRLPTTAKVGSSTALAPHSEGTESGVRFSTRDRPLRPHGHALTSQIIRRVTQRSGTPSR